MSTKVVTTDAQGAGARRVGVPDPSPSMARMLAAAAQLIRDNHRFLVTSHEYPDGDAVGASLALMHLLEALGKDVVVFNVDPVPWNFEFLAGAARFNQVIDAGERFDVTCVLDGSAADRVGTRFPDEGWGRKILAIDHHRGPFDGADVLVHDVDAASVGELIFRLADAMGVEIDLAMAECIYCSLMADTGCFRYSNTNATAL